MLEAKRYAFIENEDGEALELTVDSIVGIPRIITEDADGFCGSFTFGNIHQARALRDALDDLIEDMEAE